jgi:hypothetical protein
MSKDFFKNNLLVALVVNPKYCEVKLILDKTILAKESAFNDFEKTFFFHTLFLEFFFDLEVFFLGTAIFIFLYF